MKAIVHYNNIDVAPTILKGKDIRIHMDGPQAYHISEGYKHGDFEQHQILGIFTDVFRIALEGKPKKVKGKPPQAVTIDIDTTKLQACIKEAMLELEGLANKEQFIHKEDIDDDYLDRNISAEDLALYGVTAARVERDQLQKEVNELREQIKQLAFVPSDVATAANLLEAELLVYLDHVKNGQLVGLDPNQDIHFGNGIRFAIGKLTGNPVPFAQVPFNVGVKPTPAPAPAFQTSAIVEDAQPAARLSCICPAKRNIEKLGHLSYCPSSEYYNQEEGECPEPPKE